MTSREATRLVCTGGALRGTGGATVERFVRDRGYCEIAEVAAHAFAPTRDTPRYLLGYRCIGPGRGSFGE
ncbi:hypothetical protein [Methylobacterium sp. ID0610]|uniref:hypothetical protein n=1 Tax=Methylobacterium carpenticola TaxID=3344827 RepID=UPI0036900494